VTEPGDQLSADDAAILALESEAIAGHTLKLCVVSPAAAGPLDLEALRASVARRLAGEPRGRRRVEMTAGPESARWVEDEGFEIGAQIRRREGSEGIDEAELWRIAGELMGQRLDHSRPLWAIDLVGPLADGREAVVVRIHHAMADGVACVRFLDAVLWDAVDPEPANGGSGGGTARGESRPVSALAEARRLPGALRRELGARAARSPLDRRIGPTRELAFAATPLEELKRIGASRPGHVTVNDVLLAGVAGGLREWLAQRGSAAPRLRAQVPVSLHHRDADPGELGNRDSFLNVDLPLAEPDPLARLAAVNDETARRKSLGDAEELYDFFHALARFRHLGNAVERLAAGPREFSLSISNVPGPRRPVGIAGRRVQRLYSVAEPADRHALRISAISCAGELGVGLCTDPEAVPGVAALASAIEESVAELRAATIE
jgi:WS/DGAT/MGAT family acyltransferase